MNPGSSADDRSESLKAAVDELRSPGDGTGVSVQRCKWIGLTG
jgi:hypothetical protein